MVNKLERKKGGKEAKGWVRYADYYIWCGSAEGRRCFFFFFFCVSAGRCQHLRQIEQVRSRQGSRTGAGVVSLTTN